MKKYLKIGSIMVVLGIVVLSFITIYKVENKENIEGYISIYAGIPNTATSSNATSNNSTSSNSTSSNSRRNSTSSNSTSSNSRRNSTSNNSTSSNTKKSSIKVENSSSSKVANNTTKTEVKEKEEGDLEYNNSQISKDVLNKIINSSDEQNIIINLDKDYNIEKEIFDAIKGKNKQLTINSGENQLIFNGMDITNSKKINANISCGLISDDTKLNEIDMDGIVVKFANNGELPGVATVRVKVTDEIKNALDLDEIVVYYYNEAKKELVKLTNGASYNKNEYIEFAINHNSKYLLVNETIENEIEDVKNDAITTGSTQEDVSFLESNKVYILIIGISLIIIIVIVVIVIIDRKKKGIR